MIAASNLYKELANNDTRQFEFRITVNMVEYQSEIISCNIQGGLSSSNDIVIGATPCMRISFKMIGTIPVTYKAVIKPYVRFKGENEYSEWVQLGVYFAENPTFENNETEVIGYDQYIWLDDVYNCELTFPTTIDDLLDDIMDKTSLVSSFVPSPNIILQVPVGYTYREMLGFIASLYGGNAIFDNKGKFDVSFFRVADEIELSNCFTQSIDKESFKLKKIACVRDSYDPITYGTGDEFHTLAFINPFVTHDNIGRIAKELINLTCNKMTITKQGTGLYYLGERLKTIDNTDKSTVINLIVSTYELNFEKGGFTETIGSCIRIPTDTTYNKQSSLQKSVDTTTKQLTETIYGYTNDSIVNIGATDVDVIRIRVTSDYNSTPIFIAYINLNCTSEGLFTFKYYLDNVIQDVTPMATLTSGYHIINLFLPLEFDKNTAHELVVLGSSDNGGVAIIQRHQIQACIKGQGLTAKGSKWDGTINLDVELADVKAIFKSAIMVDMPLLTTNKIISRHAPINNSNKIVSVTNINPFISGEIEVDTSINTNLILTTKEENDE